MAYCTKCGTKLRGSDRFCPGCGAQVDSGDNETRSQVFHGSIHKCPNCGETVEAFTAKCPTCGYEFRDAKGSSAVREFSERIDQLQSQKKLPTVFSGVAKVFGVGKTDNTEEQILDTIRNFAVPNTKEDVFEFMILASSNINTSVISAENSHEAGANSEEEFNAMKARNDAWLAKLEQVYQKAKLSFGDDPDFSKIEEIYTRTTGSIAAAEKKKRRSSMFAGLSLAIMAALGISFFVIKGCSHSLKERQLQQTVQEIQVDIANEDYDAALVKAQTLHMDDDWSSESEEHWDQQRESLIELIKEKKAEKE